jgi:hypothetical protein
MKIRHRNAINNYISELLNNIHMKKKSLSPSQKKVAKVMHEFKEGELHSGQTTTIVTNPKQAIAIALTEARALDKN